MKRVLHIVRSMDMGGIENFIMNIYRQIDRNKIQFDFMVSIETFGFFDDEIKLKGGNIYYIPPRNKGIIKHKKALRKFFKEKNNDYVAVHQHSSSLTSISPLIYAKKYGINTRIIHSHSTLLKSSNQLHYLLHTLNKFRISHYANYMFACSDLAANWFYKSKKNISIINNGIDTLLFKYDVNVRNKVRDNYYVNDKIVFGHIGSFIKVKNQKYVIDVFKSFLEINPNAVLWFVGDGIMRREIEEYAQNVNIFDKIVFFGIRGDTNQLVQGMDIFIFPSIFEGLPLTLVEAQTAGLKIFASENISALATLTDNIKFFNIDLKPEIWANEISKVLPYERQDCSKEIVTKGFDTKNTTQYLEKIYIQ